jgi:hypothetical protein
MSHQIVNLSTLPKGEFFRKLRKGKPFGDQMTKRDYCRSERKFECYYESDISRNAYLSGTTSVAIGEDY